VIGEWRVPQRRMAQDGAAVSNFPSNGKCSVPEFEIYCQQNPCCLTLSFSASRLCSARPSDMLLRKRFFDSRCRDDFSSSSSPSKCEPEYDYEHDKDQTCPHPSSHVGTIMAPSKTNGVERSGNGHAIKSESTSIDSHVNGQTSTQEKNLSTRTDYSRWRLLDERGRQTWQYLEDDEDVAEWPQSTADKYFLGLPTVCMPILGLLNKLLNIYRTSPIYHPPKPLSMR
jgi:hypothetical protein